MNEREIFANALQRPSDSLRLAYLDNVCSDDAKLRARIDTLLREKDELGSFLESASPAVTGAMDMPPIAERPGQTIGRYKLLQEIGEGGFGVVYMAEQREPVRRKVALKIIKPGMDTKEVVARFEAERQALAMMDHPNIAKVHDGGATESGRPYFVMELVHGIPLTDYCDENNLTTRQRLELFVLICQAVQHAHQKGVIHRDIKPSNVMITLHDGVPAPKIIDFGIAKATGQRLTEKTVFTGYGQMIGTPLYMSPEQAEISGLDIDTRSDIYSLGVLLYELLTGTTPFDKETFREARFDEIRRIIREQEPPKPSERITTIGARLSTISEKRGVDPRKLKHTLRGELDWIVMRALEKDRTRRYETANGFTADIRRYLADEPVEACPPSTAYRLKKFVRRNKAFLTTVALVLITAMLGAGASVWQAVQATRERDRANAEARIAAAVNAFLNDDLLAQANPANQPDPNVTLRAVIDRAAEKIEDQFADQPLVEAAIRYTLAKTYEALGDYDEAKKHADRSLQLRTRHLGADDAATIEAARLAASVLCKQGDYRASRRRLETLLPRARRALGPEDPVTLKVMHSLAGVTLRQGDYPAAERLFRQTLEIRRHTLGHEHPDTLKSMNNLAELYRLQGRYAEAEELNRQTLAICRRTLGDEHPRTLDSMNNLGCVYFDQGSYEEAEELYRQTLEIKRRTLGDEHPRTLDSMNNLAVVYKAQGRYDEAEELHRQTLELKRRTLGDEHPLTLVSMENLAGTCLAQGRYDEAEELCRQTLEIVRRTLGDEHPHTLDSMNYLACVYANQGRHDEAEKLYRRTLEIKRRTLGGEHPGTLASMNNLALVCKAQGRHDEAEELYRQTLDIYHRTLGDEHPHTLNSMNNLAIVYLEQDRYDEAEELYRPTVQLMRRVLGDEHPHTLMSVRNLAAIYVKKAETHTDAQDWPAALECMTPILELQPGAKTWRTLTALQLHLGDAAGYRQACQAAWKQLAESDKNWELAILATFCSLAPDSGVEAEQLVALGSQLVEEKALTTHRLAKGMAEYRAGKFVDVLATLPTAATIECYRSRCCSAP